MKKLFVIMVVALLAIALVACGGNGDTTTTEAPGTTQAPGTTTQAPSTTQAPTSSTEDGGEVTPPEDRTWIDLINDEGYWAINASGVTYIYGFEDTHAELDNHVALVLTFNEEGGVYTELFLNTAVEGAVPEPNKEYTWYIKIDGTEYKIERFSLYNNGTSGWVRCDLGEDFTWDKVEWDDNNEHEFLAELSIKDSSMELAYYADLTPFGVGGGFIMEKPAAKELIQAENRNPDYKQINSDAITVISGPSSANKEGVDQLFDGSILTKCCTYDNDELGACVISFTGPKAIAAISFVNANDNQGYSSRTLVAFELYGSNDLSGEWTLIHTETGLNEDGSAIDKGPLSANYAERYYEINVTEAYKYYKLVPKNGTNEMWQASEMWFFEED